jgi:ribosomal-protein-alanine N-acetyltransferase
MQQIHSRLPSLVLETPRLWLKELNPAIMDEVFTTFSDEEIMQFMGLGSEEELALEKHKVEEGLTMYRISFRHFLMIEKISGDVIGRIGYRLWHVPHSRAEIGYGISRDENKGKGYMTEAIKVVVKHGFEDMQLNRIEAFIGSRNEASIALVTRLGFMREGLMREHYCKNEVIENSLCFSLLKREYDAKNR